MGQYDTKDVKSVQKFLGTIKEKFDAVNAELPEEASNKLDFDEFSEEFFKANDGLIQNRDALKKEKLTLSEKLEETSNSLSEMEKKLGSIDENLPEKYNKTIEELNALKDTIKDGSVDLDAIKQRHQSEMERLQEEYDKKMQESISEKEKEVEKFKSTSDTFKDLYFKTLRKDELANELDRINVNPEDRPLIMQANLGRATIEDDGEGNFSVVYKDDKGKLLPGKDFWDSWASNEKNQRYLLAEENTGGGASGLKKSTSISKAEKLAQQLSEATDLKEKIRLAEELSKQ